MNHQHIIFSNNVGQAIDDALGALSYNRLFVITDDNTRQLVLPRLSHWPRLGEATNISFPAGDANKNLQSLTHVWQQLEAGGGTRHSVALCLGGGVVTDLGGMAAATFKRGIPFINVPTTLLSAVDAAVGGKTGINFSGLKNEVGVFQEATSVIISTRFFDTLPQGELYSGYAEMIKHGMLKGAECFVRLLSYDISCAEASTLLPLLQESVQVKADIVRQDPHEQGLRRALNLGHTVGHAFESLALRRHQPVPHGYAVAWGLLVETLVSHLQEHFDSRYLNPLGEYIREHYGAFHITCDDYEALLDLMRHDKKSLNGEINCTLLSAPGEVLTGCTVTSDTMQAALDIYRDFMGI